MPHTYCRLTEADDWSIWASTSMAVVLTERPFAYDTGQGTLEIHVQLLGGAV